jgi:hypothetical protein
VPWFPKDLQTKVERADEKPWTAIQALAPETVRGALAPLIGDDAVNAMLERPKRIQVEVDKLVAEKRRDFVIVAEHR